MPIIPQIYFSGYTNANLDAENLLDLNGALLMPVFLNDKQVVFWYGQVNYASNNVLKQNRISQWISSGLGYRQLYKEHAILGGYLLADASRYHAQKFYLWELNPGMEILSKIWELRANLYLPLNTQSNTVSGWADDFNIYRYIKFSGHQQWDRVVKLKYSVQENFGADAEIGRVLFDSADLQINGYLGGYYYFRGKYKGPQGFTARLIFKPKSSLTFSVNGGYDLRQHKKILALGVSVAFDKLFASRGSDYLLAQQFLSNIERNVKILSRQNYLPKARQQMKFSKQSLEQDNIYFFSNTKSDYRDVFDGTFEHPFAEFGQAKIKELRETGVGNANLPLNLYFAPGSYDLKGIVNLPTGWGIYGRSNDYKLSAHNSARPLFIGGLILTNNNRIDSVRLQNTADPQLKIKAGIKINDAADRVVINNVMVGKPQMVANNDAYYNEGISVDKAKQLTINASQIYAHCLQQTTNNNIFAAAIHIIKHIDRLNIYNSVIKADAVAHYKQNYAANAFGILLGRNYLKSQGDTASIAGNIININNSTISAVAHDYGGGNHSGNGYGLLIGYASGEGDAGSDLSIQANILNVKNSYILGAGEGGLINSGNGYGVLLGFGEAVSFGGDKSNFEIQHNVVRIIASKLLGSGASAYPLNNYSGNSYGLLIGYGIAMPTTEVSGAGADFSIHNNYLMIKDSDLKGKTTDNKVVGGNAYGLLFGYGEALPAVEATNSKNDLSIYDNLISISNSFLLGSTVTDKNPEANAYGFLIGYNVANPTADYSDAENNLNIYRNQLQVSRSKLEGESRGTTTLSGNAYGLGFGCNISVPDIEATSSANYLSFHDNKINIFASNLQARSSINALNEANSYAVLFGFGKATAFNFKNSVNDFSIYNNRLEIVASFLSSRALNDGNSYGLLFGYNSRHDIFGNFSKANIYANYICFVDNIVQSKLNNGEMFDQAYGIAIGLNGNFVPNKPNLLQAVNDVLFLDADGDTAWGVKMAQNGGDLKYYALSIARFDAGVAGDKIFFPNGDCWGW